MGVERIVVSKALRAEHSSEWDQGLMTYLTEIMGPSVYPELPRSSLLSLSLVRILLLSLYTVGGMGRNRDSGFHFSTSDLSFSARGFLG
jgi:hypothetical protein